MNGQLLTTVNVRADAFAASTARVTVAMKLFMMKKVYERVVVVD